MNLQAVVSHNVLAMYADPERSEMVSQAILGETVRVLANADDFCNIETPDGYTGWALCDHLAILETGERYPGSARAAMVSSLILPVYTRPSALSARHTLLTIGTVIELANEPPETDMATIRLPRGETVYAEASSLIVPKYPPLESLGPNLAVVARGMIGVPYLWGGRTPFGIDCSGFVQRVYWLCGHTIPRDAYLQAQSTLLVPVERDALKAGDLVFFAGDRDPRQRGVTHVGLALDDRTFIHASTQLGVDITPLAAEPYGRQFRMARRLAGP